MTSKIKSKFLDRPYEVELPTKVDGLLVGYSDRCRKILEASRHVEMANVLARLLHNKPCRINFDYDEWSTICAAMSDYVVDPAVESKSAKISVKVREEGNAYFKSGDLEKALERYTMSMAFAPAGSRELAMAYANRSAVLFKAKWMADCLVDIDRALQLEYPDNLKTKLFLRKAGCYQALDPKNRGPIDEAFAEARRWLEKVDKKNQAAMKQMLEEQVALKPNKKTICYKFDADLTPPKLNAENPAIPGLSDAVELQYSREFGRHCIATRDIKPGEVIGVQKPYINVLFLKWRYQFCWHCGIQIWSSIPCDGCAEVVYCSINCHDNSKKEYHDVECYVLPRVLAFGLENDFVPALRLTIQALKESNNSLANLRDKINKLNAVEDPMKRGFINGKLDPSTCSSVLCLEKPKYPPDRDEGISNLIQGLLMAYFLTKKMQLISSWQGDLNALTKDELFPFLNDFIVKNARLTVRNSYPVYLDSIDPNDSKKISNAITPCFAIFNHSCEPMTNFVFQSGQWVMSAVVPIKKNHQIFIGNEISFLTRNKFRRESALSELGMECQCKACIHNWPTFTEICEDERYQRELASGNLLKSYAAAKKCESDHKSIYQYAKENNRIIDYSKERASFAKLVGKIYHGSNINSVKVLMAINRLEVYMNYAQRPFLSFN